MNRPLVTLALTLSILATAIPSSEAGRKADTRCDGEGCEATAGATEEPRRRGGGRRRTSAPNPVSCRYRKLNVDPATVFYRPDGSVISATGDGQWYQRECVDAREQAEINEAFGDNSDPVDRTLMLQQQLGSIERRPFYLRAPAAAPALAEEARSRLTFPALTPRFAPSTPWTFVNHPTALWLGGEAAAPRTATAEVPGVRVTVSATVEAVRWDTGDGATELCHGPGRQPDPSVPGDHGDCTHTWAWPSASEPSGAFQVVATVFWRVVWEAEGAPGGGDLGLIPQQSEPLAVPVAEIQIVNTPSDR